MAGALRRAVEAFAITIALHVVGASRNLLYFAPGSYGPDLVNRLLSSASRVPVARLETGTLNDHDWTRLSAALGRLASTRWQFITDRQTHPGALEGLLRRSRRKGEEFETLLVETAAYADGRLDWEKGMAAYYKTLAREQNICVVLSASLPDRERASVEHSVLQEIEPSSLADIADAILLINPQSSDTATGSNALAISVATDSHGSWQTIDILWDPATYWCSDIPGSVE